MEERAQEEKQKTTAAEAKVAKLQVKNRALNEENTQLRQILQQIQVKKLCCCYGTGEAPTLGRYLFVKAWPFV